MKLPNADRAVVEREKIMAYLLNPTHRYGASKARFFHAFGFSPENWEDFAQALREHAQMYDVAKARETGFGSRYAVEGALRTPDGRRPLVCSVWQQDRAAAIPRLITAYPLEKKYD